MSDLRSLLKPAFLLDSSSSSAKPENPAGPLSPSATSDEGKSRTPGKLSKSRKQSTSIAPSVEKELPALTSKPPTSRYSHPEAVTPASRPSKVVEEVDTPADKRNPLLIVEKASPGSRGRSTVSPPEGSKAKDPNRLSETTARVPTSSTPTLASRRHSPITFNRESTDFHFQRRDSPPRRTVIKPPVQRSRYDYERMVARKIWVKQSNAIPTQVAISDDDLVDDVKDMILRKYANSLGRNFDPPDVCLKIVLGPRSSRHTNERILQPDENISHVLEMHYPGGQSIDEALLIDVIQKKTPKHSPRIAMPYYVNDEARPAESGNDYFPPMPMGGPKSPHGHMMSRPPALPHPHTHSIAVLETGHVPSLPSPGAVARLKGERSHRPKYQRQHTSSPTAVTASASIQNLHNKIASPPILHEKPAHQTATPAPRGSSPHGTPKIRRPKKDKAVVNGGEPGSPGPVGGSIPPINCLIVEDNVINMRLLAALLKRLNVRWSTAVNGQLAVDKWREGGYHLVLMDIQMPVMNGLDATKEIRRLEGVNKIGALNNVGCNTPIYEKREDEAFNADGSDGSKGKSSKEDDLFKNIADFKSPVIIVALTASSLQSDRHEALAAGCNDFLTKPVNFDWLSRKVREWGCMQALIDFEGWRTWRDFSADNALPNDSKKGPPAAPIKSPLMNGKQKKHLGITDGGGSSSDGDTEGGNSDHK